MEYIVKARLFAFLTNALMSESRVTQAHVGENDARNSQSVPNQPVAHG